MEKDPKIVLKGHFWDKTTAEGLIFVIYKSYSKCTTPIRGLRSRMAFPGNRKFPVPSIREHLLPGPDLVPAFGTALFPVSFISQIFPEFSGVTRPENISLVPVPPIREMSSSLVSSRSKQARERRPLTPIVSPTQ